MDSDTEIEDPTCVYALPEETTQSRIDEASRVWVENARDIAIESTAVSICYEPSLDVRWSFGRGMVGELVSARLTFEGVVLETEFSDDSDYDPETSTFWRYISWEMDDPSRYIAIQLDRGELLKLTLRFSDKVRGDLEVAQRFVVVEEHGFHEAE